MHSMLCRGLRVMVCVAMLSSTILAGTTRPAGGDAQKAIPHRDEKWVRDTELALAGIRAALATEIHAKEPSTRPAARTEGEPNLLARIWQAQVTQRLIDLWMISGHAEPVYHLAYGDLYWNADKIADAYEQWLRSNRSKTREELAFTLLEENIEALDSPYTWPALCVIQDLVLSRPRYIIVGEEGKYVPVPRQNQQDAHRAMLDWYRKAKSNLRWSSEYDALVPRGDTELLFPKLALIGQNKKDAARREE